MNKWSLNAKFFSVMLVLMVASVAISYLGLSKMGEIKTALNSIVQGPAVRVGHAHQIKELFLIQIVNEKNLILDEGNSETHLKRLNDRHNQILKLREDAAAISTENGKKDLQKFEDLYTAWWAIEQKIIFLVKDNKTNEAFLISRDQGREMRLKVEELMDEVVERNEGFMAGEMTEADNDYTEARNLMLAFSIGSIVLGLLLAFWVLRNVGNSVNSVIKILTEGSTQVSHAAHQIASSSEELSQAATEQASSLEETASSIEEMNSMVQKNAENARRASELASSSNESAEKGKRVVKDMLKAIDEIHTSNTTIKTQIDLSNQQISDIVKVISEIGNKTKVINDIVFQTKLLSFNASVEAARAGEHGKGFAVVAEEVGNLAQMSGNAAKEISTMLDESIHKVESIVSDTKAKVAGLISEGQHKVEIGTRIAQECDAVLGEIVDNVSNVTQMANEISTACQEQAQGVQEITKAMSQLDQVTQTNAATSEEVASSAEELSGQSESLRGGVIVLVKTIKGHSAQVDEAKIEQPAESHTQSHKKQNVVPLRAAKPKNPVVMKQAVGSDFRSVPSEHDERFKDI